MEALNLCTKMDVVSTLPPEISLRIFKFLTIRDLYNCMAVCRNWRTLINCNYMWTQFYKFFDIEELDEYEGDPEGNCVLPPLCSRAVELKNYLLGPGYNWRNENILHSFINLKFRQWKIAGCEPYFAILYLVPVQLHVFHITNKRVRCINIFDICQAPDSIDQLVMNSKYIVFGFINITYVYKLLNGSFYKFKVFVMRPGRDIVEMKMGVEDHSLTDNLADYCMFERILIDDQIWITDGDGLKILIGLEDGQRNIMVTNHLHTKVVSSSKLVLNFTSESIMISDPVGNKVSMFSVQNGAKTFYMNPRVLCILFPQPNEQLMIDCRDIKTGECIRTFLMPERTRVTIHPKKDILYMLSTASALYSVTSVCINTGNTLWKWEVDSGPCMFWGSFLSVVNNRYLVVYPAPINDDCFAFFDLRGKLIYQSPFTCGILVHFSDSMVVAKEEGRLHFMIFSGAKTPVEIEPECAGLDAE